MTGMYDDIAAFAKVFALGAYRERGDSITFVDQCHITAATVRYGPQIGRILNIGLGIEERLSLKYRDFETIGEPCVVNISFLRDALALFDRLGWESVVLRVCKGVPMRAPRHRRELGDTPLEILPWMPRRLEDIDDSDPADCRVLIAPMNPNYNEEYMAKYLAIMENEKPSWVKDACGDMAFIGEWFNRLDAEAGHQVGKT